MMNIDTHTKLTLIIFLSCIALSIYNIFMIEPKHCNTCESCNKSIVCDSCCGSKNCCCCCCLGACEVKEKTEN